MPSTVEALGTRCVERLVPAGLHEMFCGGCGKPVKFQAVKKLRCVIANVYVKVDSLGRRRLAAPGTGGVWDRCEYWHLDCYHDADRPYGDPVT